MTIAGEDGTGDVLWSRRVSGHHYLECGRILNAAPPALRTALEARYAAIAGPERKYWVSSDGRVLDSWNEATSDLRHMGRALDDCRARIAHDDDALEVAAEHTARVCMELQDFGKAYAYAQTQHIRLPQVGGSITERSITKRMRAPDWWRRQLRTHLTRGCEELFRVFGFVRDPVAPYVSADGFARVQAAAHKARLWMTNMTAVCEDTGEALPLAQIAEHSLSNPALRRGELMVRARGFQEVAESERHRCMMVTLTCPSAFHAWLRECGERNPRFRGGTPRDGQQWLTSRWASARATLKRERVLYYGFRVAEPHHDGTPHWHMVMYASPNDLETIQNVLTRTWLKYYADEPGATKHRIKFTEEHPAKGSGVGYLAKYIAKNIDAAGSIGDEVSDESAHPVSENALRAVAWARLHGIRQFQQLGGPAVTLWRHLRRVREPCEWPPLERLRLTTTNRAEPTPVPAIAQGGKQRRGAGAGSQNDDTSCSRSLPRQEMSSGVPPFQRDGIAPQHPADSVARGDNQDEIDNGHGDGPPGGITGSHHISGGPSWSAFIKALGGISQCLSVSKSFWTKEEPRCIDAQGRKVLRLTRWGELPVAVIVGLEVIWAGPDGVERIRRLPTRVHVWFLIFSPAPGRLCTLGPVAITVAGAPSAGSTLGWTNPHESSQAPPLC